MRTSLFLLTALLSLAILAGCMKTSTGPGGGGNNLLLVKSFETQIYDSTNANNSQDFTNTYTYNNNNQPVEEIEKGTAINQGVATPINDTFYFTYAGRTVTELAYEHFLGLAEQVTVTNYLQQNTSYPDTAIATSSYANFAETISSTYTYDANGYCTEIVGTENLNGSVVGTTDETFTVSNGDVVQMENVETAPGFNADVVETLTIGTLADNTTVSPSVPPFAGHQDLNLVVSTQTTTNGSPTSALNYAYTFDNQMRVSSITVTTPSGFVYLKMLNIVYL